MFNTNNQLSDYWTISAHLINEFRIGFMGEYDLISPRRWARATPRSSACRWARQTSSQPSASPTIYGLGPGSPSFANYKENNFDMSDQVTLIKGRHLLHFGGELVVFRADSTAWGAINSGQPRLHRRLHGRQQCRIAGIVQRRRPMPISSSAMPSPGRPRFRPEYGGRLKNPGVFVQDDFKVNPEAHR